MSTTRRLISTGFSDLDRAGRFLAAPELEEVNEDLLFEGLALAADPDQALLSLVRLLEKEGHDAGPHGIRSLLTRGGDAAEPLFRLLGASEALADFLIRNPGEQDVLWHHPGPEPVPAGAEVFRTALLREVGADPHEHTPVSRLQGEEAVLALRTRYRALLTRIAIEDICAADPRDLMPSIGAALADLAAGVVHAALAVARTEATALFTPEDVAQVKIAVIGMGKCGARELNYISDVDVIYVMDPGALDEAEGVRIGTYLVSTLAKIINAPAREPGLWEVDANLRPEGKDGPLVRTLDSHRAYYERWAASWEFQALLKARAMAGDSELGRAFEDMVSPMVWDSAAREGFVESVQAMRRRVTDHIPAAEVDRQIKLGPGGLRDVEFTVQLLQLVHGRFDSSVRVRDTTSAISALSRAGYIGRGDATEFDRAYRQLRVMEHRIQLVHMRRTHLMPVRAEAQRALARSVEGSLIEHRTTAEGLRDSWKRTKRRVQELHEQIFYRPLLNTSATLSRDEVRLTSEAASARLAALGYRDPEGALRHITALTSGVSRRAQLQRQLLPVLLGWLAEGLDPDAGLLAFRRISESLGRSHWYLGLLRDSKAAAERLCHVLSDSRLIADLLEVSPESVAWLGNDRELVPVPLQAQAQEIQSKLSRHDSSAEAVRLIRLIRRREILRTAIADAAGLITQEEVSVALANADQACIQGALTLAEREVFAESAQATEVLVVAMGRQGGREVGYGSDADVMYVHRPVPGPDGQINDQLAQQQATAVVTRLAALLTQPVKPAVLAERVLQIDTDLRPEGRNGLLVRSLDSYAEYYRRWSLIWEAQALLRARPMAGSQALAEEFIALIDPIRYPASISPADVREVRRIKARVETERLPRGADPSRHVKLGRGGLSDVEWLVQLLQLEHAHAHEQLRTTSTMQALKVASGLSLITDAQSELLEDAWKLASRVRSANVIWSSRSSDVLPSARRDLNAVARWSGTGDSNAAEFEEHYLKLTRRARAVFEEVFYSQT